MSAFSCETDGTCLQIVLVLPCMQIYMDESGSFLQPRIGHRVSAVGALVVPDAQADALFDDCTRLIRSWGNAGEVKGSRLSEIEIAGVIELVGRYEVLFDVRAIDMGQHEAARIAAFQDRQSTAVTEHITKAHHASWQEWVAKTEASMRALSPQLFTQCMVTIYLVLDLIQVATLYYAQRLPDELGRFRWRIDPKDPTRRTELERLWTDVILPMGQTQSIGDPFSTMEGCDYSAFKRYYIDRKDMPPSMVQHLSDDPNAGGLNFEKILLEDIDFPDSKSDVGLQIVDILLAAFCRALNGTLDERGWAMLGRLMTHIPRNRNRVVFLRLRPDENVPMEPREHAVACRTFDRQQRDILTPDRRRG